MSDWQPATRDFLESLKPEEGFDALLVSDTGKTLEQVDHLKVLKRTFGGILEVKRTIHTPPGQTQVKQLVAENPNSFIQELISSPFNVPDVFSAVISSPDGDVYFSDYSHFRRCQSDPNAPHWKDNHPVGGFPQPCQSHR